MKKGEIVELVILKENGGVLTQDSKIKREDVTAILPAAINWAITGQFWANKQATGDSEYPSDFIATYPNVEVKTDTDRDLKYIDLPAGTITLPDDRGLQSVSPMKGTDQFIPIKLTDSHNISYYHNTFAGYTLFWRERQRVLFQNIATDKVLVRLIQSIGDIGDDEELPIPAGTEIDVLKFLDEWFSGQKAMTADYKPDNNNNLQ